MVTFHTLDPSVSGLHMMDITSQKVYDFERKVAHVPLSEKQVISLIKKMGPDLIKENRGLLIQLSGVNCIGPEKDQIHQKDPILTEAEPFIDNHFLNEILIPFYLEKRWG